VSFERYTDKITAGTKVETTAGSPIIGQQLTSEAVETIETANRDPGSHLRRAAEDAGKHVVALDRALEDELTRSIESRGRWIPRSAPGDGLMVIFLLMTLSHMMRVEAGAHPLRARLCYERVTLRRPS